MATVVLGLGAKALFFHAAKAPAMATATATQGDLEETVLSTGSLEPVRLVSVGAQASGQVTSLKVALGDRVHKGDLIAEIDSASQQNALRTAQAALDNVKAQRLDAEATLAQTDAAFRRQSQLSKSDSTSKADYDTAEANYKSAKAKVEEIKAQIASAQVSVDTAKVNLGYTRIAAPMDGTVVAIVTKQGQTVNASLSTPTIVKLAQLETMTVKAQISEADVIKVKPGQSAYFTIMGDHARKYYATLRAIEPAPVAITDQDTMISSTSTTYPIYYSGLFEVPNTDGRLRTFMTAQVSIVVASAKNAVIIPAAALGRKVRDGVYEVQVVGKDGQPKPRQVTTGLNAGTSVQVLSGLSQGEKVVIGGAPAASAGGTAKPLGKSSGPPSPMGF
ncbi:MAG: efflux RND transporter periplasmic adaptor subunit [Caulobacteraceae bacterium]|nr:efflux RND transporter periplasmic adaptor subunit [Caulobacteraceae bacterium]